jgi:hypothetical protein
MSYNDGNIHSYNSVYIIVKISNGIINKIKQQKEQQKEQQK